MMKTLIATSITACLALPLAACGDDDGDGNNVDAAPSTDAPPDPGFGSAAEVTEAETAFSGAQGENFDELMNDWAFFPSTTFVDQAMGIVTSASPHGNGFARIFVNKTFTDSQNKASPDVGSILIKVNLNTQSITDIDSYTVMVKKASGFDTDNKDWFWAKLDTEGKVASNPMGTKLAGKATPCITCHTTGDANDLIVSAVAP